MLDTDQLRSFVSIVDTGSFTRAAERVNKTQSAVSMHIRRLEEQLGRALFLKQGRGVKLSEDGEKLIDYARQMLQIEAAAFATVSNKALGGRIRLGIPDDYAETFLPDILTRFSYRHPLVEVSVVCENSVPLAERVASRELDMAVVTSCAVLSDIEVLREEALHWVAGGSSRVYEQRPLPLALSGPTCAWRARAVAALNERGIAWRQMLASASQAAIAPVVLAGLAVTVMPRSAMRPGMRVIDEDADLPELGPNRIGVIEARGQHTPEADVLAEEIRAALRGGSRVPAAEPQEAATGRARGRAVA
ncbi:LysR substrate-binding domain-containing protein [Alsobacter sp. SYSU M60028]|uniref:LysR substrate-binding domain-containing protein n=1 Tax=Alsobacter ponti TaxID=2962936 RepID=A0ABT1LI53_9HYPH|nr:LysR substrate-binding domain-containing protein [Alsobacter ponti]MCP8940568.1 LysR substrate-binding domain-containing protein [Alsobacter ponti]